ncbi:MAG: tetratricopeptide repeat protein [Methanoregula sp.]
MINIGRLGAGKKAFIRANQVAPQLSFMRRNYGGALFLSKRSRNYVVFLDKKRKAPRDVSLAWYSTGLDLYQNHRNEEAIGAFHRVLALDPASSRSWYYIGRAAADLGRYKEALKAYDHALRLDPANKQCWNNKGLIHWRLGQSDAAITSFHTALDLDKKYFHGWYNLGLVLRDLHRYTEAIEVFSEALILKPGDSRALNRKHYATLKAGLT